MRIVDSEEQMVWADLGSSGAIGYTIEGKSRQGESGTHEVCSILLAKLNGEGASWNNLKDVSANESQQLAGIDCQACDENNVLNIQVTRVERSIWKDLAEQGIASREPAVESVVDKIRTVIIEKSKTIPDHEIAKLVLALNALETPVYAFERVVNDFRSKYGSSVKSFGSLSIWVVGPTESLTYRLDKKQVNSESSD